jgi:hypothetical protein
MIEELEKQLNVKFPPGETLHTAEANQFLRDLCTKVGGRHDHGANDEEDAADENLWVSDVAQRRLLRAEDQRSIARQGAYQI